MPTMGWMPAPAIFSENSSAPNRLFVSVSASAGMWSLSASFFSSSMRSAPSSSEKAEWTCRCTNPTSRKDATHEAVLRTAHDHPRWRARGPERTTRGLGTVRIM